MKNKLYLMFILFYLSTTCLLSQTIQKPTHNKGYNALLPENCYIKNIYNFPYKVSTVYYSEQFPDLEIRKYENSEFIIPLFNLIFKENYKVYNPNFWGSIEDLVHTGPSGLIDTNGILLYMHAGWDTAFSINDNNQITLKPFYTPPDYKDISGLFFFETWHIDPDKGSFQKNVIAYFPIREYWDDYSLEAGQAERLRRLIFMVYSGLPESKSIKSQSKNKYKRLTLLYSGIEYEIDLYNRPYHEYIHRDDSKPEMSDEEYNEWEYHTFDFYKYFDAERFLKVITGLILTGKIHAVDPFSYEKVLTPEDIIDKIGEKADDDLNDTREIRMISPLTIRYDNLNSAVFNEDWYFDPGSLKIYKKVNSITILKFDHQYDNYTGDYLRVLKTPVFTVIY